MAHALPHHKGPCRNIHGHSYKLSVTVSGKPRTKQRSADDGMVMDFTALKEIVQDNIICLLDHALVLNEQDKEKFPQVENSTRTVFFPFSPTCEMLLVHICGVLNVKLPAGVKLCTVRLDETATSFAEWHCSDNR